MLVLDVEAGHNNSDIELPWDAILRNHATLRHLYIRREGQEDDWQHADTFLEDIHYSAPHVESFGMIMRSISYAYGIGSHLEDYLEYDVHTAAKTLSGWEDLRTLRLWHENILLEEVERSWGIVGKYPALDGSRDTYVTIAHYIKRCFLIYNPNSKLQRIKF
jgi:hypothetical protein